MIIIHFPKTLGGVSFEKAGKLYEGEGTIFFDKMVPSPSYSLTFQKNDQRECPLETPYNTELKNSIFYTFVYLKCLLLNYI